MKKNGGVFILSIIILSCVILTGCSKTALDIYKENVKKHPDNPKAHIDLAYKLTELKQYESAVAEYDKALKLRPNDFLAANNKGYVLFNMGRYDEALSIFETLAPKNPKDSSIVSNIAMCLKKQKKYNEAYFKYNEALKINPKNPLAKDGLKILREDMKKKQLPFPPTMTAPANEHGTPSETSPQ